MEHFYYFIFCLFYSVFVFLYFAGQMINAIEKGSSVRALITIFWFIILLAAPYVFMNGSQLG